MKLSTAVLSGLVATALAAPGIAQAATLTADRACYAPRDLVGLSGTGFTPGGGVALSVEGRQLGTGSADPAGAFRFTIDAPAIDGVQRTDTFTATDQTDLSIAATAGVKLTSLDVRYPKRGKPGKPQRIKARGFTSGKSLYAHIRRGKARRNVKVGKLKGACKTLSVKRTLFRSDAKSGTYLVQFDTRRKYSAKTAQQVTYLVTIFRTIVPAMATAATAERRVRAR